MIVNSKRGPIAASILSSTLPTVTHYGRRAGHLLVEAVHYAYDSHMEKAQMRLAPARPRSWREIPRAGAHHDHC